MNEIMLPLNPYQAANLLWWLKRNWYWCGPGTPKPWNSGDWEGEIPQLLEKLMKEAGGDFLTHKANGSWTRDPFQNPEWINEIDPAVGLLMGGHYQWPCDHVYPKKVTGEFTAREYVLTCECGISWTKPQSQEERGGSK